MTDKCPNCNIELEEAGINDADAGEVLITVTVEYCPECLYVYWTGVELSK